MTQIDIALARRQAQEIAFAQDRGQQTGDPPLAQFTALEHEMCKTRMLADARYRAAMRRDRASIVDRPQIEQQRARRGQ